MQRSPSPANRIDGAFAERGGEDLALVFSASSCAAIEALLIFAEIEQAAAEQRQRHDIDRRGCAA